jgi:uncharacterized protein with beta-barrel porin domain
VLTASGGVTGAYTVTGDTAAGLFTGLGVTTDAHDVYLVYTKTKSFASAGGTPNQIAVGAGADGLRMSNGLSSALVELSDVASARAAFDGASGEVHASARTALVEDSRFVREATLTRLQAPAADHPVIWGQGFGDWGSTDGTAMPRG